MDPRLTLYPILALNVLAASLFVQEIQYPNQEALGHALHPAKELAGTVLLNDTATGSPIGPILHTLPRDILSATVEIPPRSVTGLLPVTPDSLPHLHEILEPFFVHPALSYVAEVVLVSPSSLGPSVSERTAGFLDARPAEEDKPKLTVRERDYDMQNGTSAFLVTAVDISTPWLLVMNWDGLNGLDRPTLSTLLRTGHPLLPIGPHGEELPAKQGPNEPNEGLRLAKYLKPPFILSAELLPQEDGVFRTWEILGQYLARCNSAGSGGLLLNTRPCNHAVAKIAIADEPNTSLTFAFLLSSGTNALHLAPLLCRLTQEHTLHIVAVEAGWTETSKIVRHKLSSTEELCPLEYLAVSQFVHRQEPAALGNPASDVVVTLQGMHLNQDFLSYFLRIETVIVRLPEDDLPYCDWMASLSREEWKNWGRPQVDISVITRNRPASLARLFDSLKAARYFGDSASLRINLEQDSDPETVDLVQNFSSQWTHGSVFVHRRIVHAGLLPAIVEAWYPASDHSYGILLEDDVEVSPLFFAWAKMATLKYRYGKDTDNSPNIFGVSLYQQRHIELLKKGRVPFNATALFSNVDEAIDPSTPYLSQVPCSWGAVYFPSHWRLFHAYLALRFEESWLPIEETVVPDVRSNHWSRSWKKFFIELVYLKGWAMLYPNFDAFGSLSTNHLELGSHVRVRSREKQDLFDLPLMQLPKHGSPTDLLALPQARLPALKDLPTLNLTAVITTTEDIAMVGQARRDSLCKDIENGRRVEDHGVHNFMCDQSTTSSYP
ncbi:glycosyltransferase 2 [Coprinopsis sp. MPI-PUGE-AT-0042]|nr:glycosyltransferase 2 [Coprinopsis sp. MPI-PUGE-AT-0042]